MLIFGPVSNQCPQGPPNQGILPPLENGPKVHLEANFRRDLKTLKTQQTRFGFVQGFDLGLVVRAGGASFGEAH